MTLSRRHLLHLAALAPTAALAQGGAPPGMPLDLAHLTHGFAPVPDELDIPRLPVQGEIPRDLAGTWLRNGPNAAFPPQAYVYPWDGDGMVHALRFRDGAVGYANRWVVTAGLEAERRAGRALYGSLMRPLPPPDPRWLDAPGTWRHAEQARPFKHIANTNVVGHAGRILALWEGGLPYELAPDLATRGPYDFAGRLQGAMTAHPKLDPATGEMLVIRYAPRPPFLSFGTVAPDGSLARMDILAVDRPHMVHDFVCTARHAVFVLCPVVFGPPAPPSGMLRWQPELGTRIAVLDRADPTAPLRWFTAEAFFTFHFVNAWEQDGRIHVDQVRYDALPGAAPTRPGSLWRLSLDLAGGGTRLAQLDDRATEFPRIDPRRAGLANRHAWLPVKTGRETAREVFGGIAHHDLATGRSTVLDLGPGFEVEEPAFVPRPGSTEDGDGWLLAYIYDRREDTTRAVMLEARDIAKGPVATISLPRRVPHGLHGNWLPA
jgi:carotenoid cleavage dioxygenase